MLRSILTARLSRTPPRGLSALRTVTAPRARFTSSAMSVYDHTLPRLDGAGELPLAAHKGKPILILNVASL